MSHPKLTIALLTYNRGCSGYLKKTLDSILAQTYSDFELLVLDNHSGDKTAELVLSYKDSRLTYVRQPPGCNASFNFNRGLWMSRGEFFLATHDDDILEPTLVERQIRFFEGNPDLACVAANVSLIDEEGNCIQPRLYEFEQDRVFDIGDYIPTYLDEKLWFPTPTCMFRRDALVKRSGAIVRASKPRYISSGDIGILFLLNMRYPIALLSDPLFRYRQHTGQESRNVDQSSPLVELADVAGYLLKKSHRGSKLRRHHASIHGFSARFKAQDFLFKNPAIPTDNVLQAALRDIRSAWVKSVDKQSRAVDAVLPFEILLYGLGLTPTVSAEGLTELVAVDALSGARLGYRNWLRGLQQGQTLFAHGGNAKRVVILGSMFTAYLLVLDALRSGVEVVACIDSSAARIGASVFGVPVVPHERLEELKGSIDAVIVSSERDHEGGIKQMISSRFGLSVESILSWKEMATVVAMQETPTGEGATLSASSIADEACAVQ